MPYLRLVALAVPSAGGPGRAFGLWRARRAAAPAVGWRGPRGGASASEKPSQAQGRLGARMHRPHRARRPVARGPVYLRAWSALRRQHKDTVLGGHRHRHTAHTFFRGGRCWHAYTAHSKNKFNVQDFLVPSCSRLFFYLSVPSSESLTCALRAAARSGHGRMALVNHP